VLKGCTKTVALNGGQRASDKTGVTNVLLGKKIVVRPWQYSMVPLLGALPSAPTRRY
jgi:hypothetical protein